MPMLEAQAFLASATDMDGFDLAALDTLPHGPTLLAVKR
jgi:hypothetical protein